jgi:hypothetical protein
VKITKRADALLRDSFTRNGEVFCSAIHTSSGSMPLWGQLVIAGVVKEIPPCLHPFNYEITDAGRDYVIGGSK